ncbi:MAG TPA: hypothetical protein VLZ74_08010 [Methylocella sp.]|nr:hypothetical protein [Methylocella sp.]
MSKERTTAAPPEIVSCDELRRILGEIESTKITEILALRPTLQELEEAALWVSGDGDLLGKRGHRLSAVAAAIVDIVQTSQEEEPR